MTSDLQMLHQSGLNSLTMPDGLLLTSGRTQGRASIAVRHPIVPEFTALYKYNRGFRTRICPILRTSAKLGMYASKVYTWYAPRTGALNGTGS